jgi:hypothetical protein
MDALARLEGHRGCFVTKIGPKGSPAGHVSRSSCAYSHNMRGAFVIQLGPESNPAEGQFDGWVEEVDTCVELRFRSTEELLNFMGLRIESLRASTRSGPALGGAPGADGKKLAKTSRRSK